jgi:hypothetical protein
MACGKLYVVLVSILALGSEASRTITKRDKEAPTWTLVEEDSYCGADGRNNLADVSSVEDCQTLAGSDPDCGDEMHTNGELCRCVKVGSECDFIDSKAGSSVYRRDIKVKDVTWATNSPKWAAARARCCCNKKKSWKDSLRLRELTGICVVVKDTDTCSKANKVWDIHELKKKVLHTHEDVEGGLCEIPEDHVQQVVDEYGPIGCAAKNMDEHGYSITHTGLGANGNVKCPRGQSAMESSVLCGSDGIFTPTPECHGE